MATGGTFCCFRTGSSGRSTAHLRYIARPGAVREQTQGVCMVRMPPEIMEIRDYTAFRNSLLAYAWVQEVRERVRPGTRTFYTAILSYEQWLSASSAKEMIKEWLNLCFPQNSAVAFLHTDTHHLHAHVWIQARKIDDRKLHLDARQYRQLDEVWNSIYAIGMKVNKRDFLLKKWETEQYKRLRREGKTADRPARVAHRWNPALFTERERIRLRANYERYEIGTYSDQSGITGGDPTSREGKSETLQRESIITSEELCINRAVGRAERSVSEFHKLYNAVTYLVERQQEIDREK